MAKIELENVKKSFDGVTVLHNINLKIEDGEFIVFVGPSGCGKSTLLRAIAGLGDIDSGRILLDGEDVSQDLPSERKLSMVFQSYALYPHMNVRENMGFSLKVAKEPKDTIAERVEKSAKILKLKDYLDRKPKELSGGQRQRVAIGRAIVREPRGFLFDEPLSNLDAALRVEMRLEIARLHKTLDSTMIYVTHDQVEAMTLAQKIVVLRDGRIEQVGSPKELYQSPQNIFVAQFIGSPKMNILQVDAGNEYLISAYESEAKKLSDKNKIRKNEIRFIGVRPEHLIIDKKGGKGKNKYPGQIHSVEYLGSDTYVYTTSPNDEPITIRADVEEHYLSGDAINLSFHLKHLHFFDGEGERVN